MVMPVARVVRRLRSAREGLWLQPLIAGVVGCGLALAIPHVAQVLPKGALEGLPTLSAESVIEMLKVITTGIITIIALSFSALLVVLNLTASQYSPRLVRGVMHGQVTQTILGIHVATFAYNGTTLFLLSAENADPGRTSLSAIGLVLTAVASLAALVWFMHHFSVALQITELLRSTHRDIARSLDALLDAPASDGPAEDPPDAAGSSLVFPSEAGYLETCDVPAILEIAEKRDLRIRVIRFAGHFAPRDEPIMIVHPAERVGPEDLANLRRAYAIGSDRTIADDLLYGIDLLAEVAMRALSPGINDPRTAANSVDYIGDLLRRLARSPLPAVSIRDGSGRIRVWLPTITFQRILDNGIRDVARAAETHPDVLVTMATMLHEVIGHALPERRPALRELVADLLVRARHAGLVEHDLMLVGEAVRTALGEPPDRDGIQHPGPRT